MKGTKLSDLRWGRTIFYGWWLVIGGFAVQNLQSSLLFLSQGAYLIELQAAFGWSRSAISGAFSLVRLESGVLGPLQGWIIDRFGPRPVMLVGSLMFGVGFILPSRSHSRYRGILSTPCESMPRRLAQIRISA